MIRECRSHVFCWHKNGVYHQNYFMNLISTKLHGVLDYVVGFTLIASPWLFGFARGGVETWVPVSQGTAAVLYSLLTNYEMGVARYISMRIHLVLDLIAGALLAFSPWIFGFSDYVWAPHLIIGLLELIVVSLSVSVSGTEVKHRELSRY